MRVIPKRGPYLEGDLELVGEPVQALHPGLLCLGVGEELVRHLLLPAAHGGLRRVAHLWGEVERRALQDRLEMAKGIESEQSISMRDETSNFRGQERVQERAFRVVPKVLSHAF